MMYVVSILIAVVLVLLVLVLMLLSDVSDLKCRTAWADSNVCDIIHWKRRMTGEEPPDPKELAEVDRLLSQLPED